jgi:hypothetical protein
MKNLRTRRLVFSLLLMTAVVTQSIGVAQTRTDSSVIDGAFIRDTRPCHSLICGKRSKMGAPPMQAKRQIGSLRLSSARPKF